MNLSTDFALLFKYSSLILQTLKAYLETRNPALEREGLLGCSVLQIKGKSKRIKPSQTKANKNKANKNRAKQIILLLIKVQTKLN